MSQSTQSSHPSWKKQLILAATLFVAGSAAYWLEFKYKPKQEEKADSAKKVFAIGESSVEILVVKSGTRTYSFKCTDAAAGLCKPGSNAKWELTAPPEAKGLHADDANVNALLSAVNNLNSTETIDLKDETPERRAALLKEYGLDPQARAATDSRQLVAGPTTAHLGLAHPIGEGIFAVAEQGGKIDDSKVFLVPSYFKTNFEHDLTYWRDKKIVPFTGAEIASFELEGSKGKVSGVKKDGQWTLNGRLAGDFENIDSLLSAVAFIQARDFLTDEKELAGTKKVLRLQIQQETTKDPKDAKSAGKAPAPILITFFEKAAAVNAAVDKSKKKPGAPTSSGVKLFAKSSNLAQPVELERSVKERLDKSAQDLRLSKLLTSVERYSVRKIEFAGKPLGAEPLRVTNVEAKWLFEDKKEASRDKVQAFLEKISGNRIQEFMPEGKIPPGEDQGIRVTLADEKDPAKRRLVFWKGGAGQKDLYARDLASKRKEAYRVDPAISEDLPWNRDHFNAGTPPKPAPSPAAPPAGKKSG